jgi:hypothetical protein
MDRFAPEPTQSWFAVKCAGRGRSAHPNTPGQSVTRAGLTASGSWGVPKVRALYEAIYFQGRRKAGMPEE